MNWNYNGDRGKEQVGTDMYCEHRSINCLSNLEIFFLPILVLHIMSIINQTPRIYYLQKHLFYNIDYRSIAQICPQKITQ